MNDANSILMKSMLQVGTLLHGGKYRIEKYLSSGGFGNTYVAIDTTFDNEVVVLKEFFIRGINERDDNSLSISVSNESNKDHFEEQKEKFWREAQRLRKLKHPNIVGVHDRFEENGTAYYVMDFIDGKSISEILKRDKKPYSEKRALEIIEKVVEALGVVHAKEMFHMDIKPGNIMIDKNDEVKLIDFGASKQIVAGQNSAISVSTSGFCFTPGYAPSEQVNQMGKNIGPWTDLYAVGGTLYNLLTLSPPPSMSDILEDEEDAFHLPEGVSEHTRQLIVWMMRPQRALRPQSAKELLAAMRGSEVPDKGRKKPTPSPATSAEAGAPSSKEPVTKEVKPLEQSASKASKPAEKAPAKKNQGKSASGATAKPKSVQSQAKANQAAQSQTAPSSEEQSAKSRKGLYAAVAAVVAVLLIFTGYKLLGGGGSSDPGTSALDSTQLVNADSLRADSIAQAQTLAEAARADSIRRADSLKAEQAKAAAAAQAAAAQAAAAQAAAAQAAARAAANRTDKTQRIRTPREPKPKPAPKPSPVKIE
ncbi:MAG: protein kinase [Bacteroidaceae bacterium]|nr:protein kinase [Bacteroidaceae bacterium]